MTDYLDEIQARADAAVALNLAAPHDSPWWTVYAAAADIPRLVATLRAVEALHSRTRRRSGFNLRVCEECGYVAPCRTVTAIRDALGQP